MDLIDEIYDSLRGEMVIPLPWVPDAFEKGSVCESTYQEIMDAYERLRQRLKIVDEDEDVETMIAGFDTIQKILCKEMYRLGYRDGMHGSMEMKRFSLRNE